MQHDSVAQFERKVDPPTRILRAARPQMAGGDKARAGLSNRNAGIVPGRGQ